MHMDAQKTRELVLAYYDCWTHGPNAKIDVERMKTLFAADLLFEGPVAGRRTGADAFIKGASDIGAKLQSFREVQAVFGDGIAAVTYDAALTSPAATVRFAEFFTITDGKISALRLLYDATEFRKRA